MILDGQIKRGNLLEINHNQILQYFSENLKTVYSKAHEEAKDLKEKFEYAFTTFIFASFALSIQFSPGFGNEWKALLLCSWLILLFSGLAGGYRLMLLSEFMRLSGIQDYLSKRVKMGEILLKNPSYVQSVQAGQCIDPDTFKPNTIEGLKNGHEDDKSKLLLCNSEVEKLEKRLPIAFHVQMYGFLLSYACLGVFVAKNYL